MIQAPGSNGTVLKRSRVYAAMPDGTGKMTPGEVELPPGTLIHVPKDEAEIKKVLNLNDPPKEPSGK